VNAYEAYDDDTIATAAPSAHAVAASPRSSPPFLSPLVLEGVTESVGAVAAVAQESARRLLHPRGRA